VGATWRATRTPPRRRRGRPTAPTSSTGMSPLMRPRRANLCCGGGGGGGGGGTETGGAEHNAGHLRRLCPAAEEEAPHTRDVRKVLGGHRGCPQWRRWRLRRGYIGSRHPRWLRRRGVWRWRVWQSRGRRRGRGWDLWSVILDTEKVGGGPAAANQHAANHDTAAAPLSPNSCHVRLCRGGGGGRAAVRVVGLSAPPAPSRTPCRGA
jgi:hypothetical protein